MNELQHSASAASSGLELIHARTLGHPGVRIALLDGPVDLAHPALAGAAIQPLCSLIGAGSGAGRARSHGTRVASVLFGPAGGPLRGVAPGVQGLSIPLYRSDGEDRILPCPQIDLARALLQALDAGAHVINVSGGQLTALGEADDLLRRAVERAEQQNVLVVAATGNHGCECLTVPAALPGVLAVGAMDAAGEPLPTSNWSPRYRGLLAPGEGILGADEDGGVSPRSATSYAAALVSGVAGLLLSLQVESGQPPDPRAVRELLLATASPCDPRISGRCEAALGGRLDVAAALAALDAAFGASPPAHSPIHPLPFSEGIEMSEKQTEEHPAQVIPADCGCGGTCGGGGNGRRQMVYPIGSLGYDFVSESRRDSFRQRMSGRYGSPENPKDLLRYLDDNPWDAEGVTWTLNLDATPIYAIAPCGAFGVRGYELLREFLGEEVDGDVERISVPGYLDGNVTVGCGLRLPVISPAIGGLCAWSVEPLVTAVLGERPAEDEAGAEWDRRSSGLRNFLDRVYYELRNLGQSDPERAMNYAATNAYQIAKVFEQVVKDGFALNKLDVVKSPICRPESSCWDVELIFFNPRARLEDAQVVYRFTVDVSNVIPVTVGPIRHWSVY